MVLNEIVLVLNEILRNHAFGGTADMIPRTFFMACVDTVLKGVDKFRNNLLHHSRRGQVAYIAESGAAGLRQIGDVRGEFDG